MQPSIPSLQPVLPVAVPQVFPDKNMAEQFLDAIDKNGEHHFRLIKQGQNPIRITSLDKCLSLNQQGYDAFFVVNRLKQNAKDQTTENIDGVRALFIDMDRQISDLGTLIKSMAIKPSIIINSSPQKYHFYFFVEQWPLDQFKAVQRHLAKKFHADPTVSDLPRVMRLAGSIHWKNKPYLSKLIGEIGDEDYSYDDICEAFSFSYEQVLQRNKSGNSEAEISDGSEWQIEYIRELLTHIESRDQTYEQWRNIAFALKSYFPNELQIAGKLFHEFSQRDSARYNERECQNQIDNADPNGGITIGTLRQMAVSDGADIGEIERKHRPVIDIFPPVPDSNCVKTKTDKLFGFPFVNSKGKPTPVIENLEYIIDQLGYQVRYNLIKKEVEIFIPDSKFSIDNNTNCSLTTLESEAIKFGWTNSAKIRDQAVVIADKNPFNPVLKFIKSKPWDGKNRLDSFYESVVSKSDPKLKQILMFRWAIQAVTLAIKENEAAQGILVFTGAQGIGKTRWFNSLVPKELGLTKDGALLQPSDKDSITQVVSYWLVELGEIDATFRKSDIAQLKSFITKSEDEVRVPYAKSASKWKRRTVFFASVNDSRFLTDDTGNRRFWTIDIETIKVDHEIDMQQLWAQFYNLVCQGERHYLDEQELSLLNSQNKEFTQIDPVLEIATNKLNWQSDQKFWSWKTSTQIAQLLNLDASKKAEINKMLNAIKQLLSDNGVTEGDSFKRTKHHRLYLCPPIQTNFHAVDVDREDSKANIAHLVTGMTTG
ncbi:VapE domain-containing protein [Glaciecola petra]|uniref:VapE family protein n=1 Tax=Glaciecola petra TaxID=3075602 RepID=A0ABU2ZQ50_9ALTE|nr:VapE domain-containing protein [Aestuariibacter sp. P117]MDT0594546.1 VapE family protein [Aestuariibacter sp. P117]